MFQKISEFGSVLSKTEQKTVNGGLRPNSDGLLCHKSDRFPLNTCPTAYFYSTTWNACCHPIPIDQTDPVEL